MAYLRTNNGKDFHVREYAGAIVLGVIDWNAESALMYELSEETAMRLSAMLASYVKKGGDGDDNQ